MYKNGGVTPPLSTSALDESDWIASNHYRFTLASFSEDGWAPGLAWTLWRREKGVKPVGNRSTADNSVAFRYAY
jgi:hypothetical protein